MNIAFFDAEYNNADFRKNSLEETIQVGFIICDESKLLQRKEDYVLNKYMTFVKPTLTKKLSKYVKKVTNITQKQIDEGVTFKEAYSNILNLIEEYDIKKIYVWGSDKPIIIKEFILHRKEFTNKQRKIIPRIMEDLSYDISKKIDKDQISLQNIAYIYSVKPQKSHDALDDALTLMEVYKKYKILNKDELEEFKKRKALFKKYKKEKNTIQKLCTVVFPILDNEDDLDLLIKEASKRYETKDMCFDSFDEWREKE